MRNLKNNLDNVQLIFAKFIFAQDFGENEMSLISFEKVNISLLKQFWASNEIKPESKNEMSPGSAWKENILMSVNFWASNEIKPECKNEMSPGSAWGLCYKRIVAVGRAIKQK